MGAELAVLRGREVLKKTSDINTVASALVEDEVAAAEGKVIPFPKLPKPRELTYELSEQLVKVPGVFGRVELDERRTLSEDELTALYEEHQTLDGVVKALAKRIEDLKEYVRTDMDVRAEEDNLAFPKDIVRGKATVAKATPRDRKGHYILAEGKGRPYKVPVKGTDRAYSQEFSQGKVTVDGDKLLDLYEAGEITRDELLAFTRETRVLDESKAGAALRENPERALEILKMITTHEPPSTSLYVREA